MYTMYVYVEVNMEKAHKAPPLCGNKERFKVRWMHFCVQIKLKSK